MDGDVMNVYRITGNEIGPDGNGAAHFPTWKEANKAAEEYFRDTGNSVEIEQFRVTTQLQLANLLDETMGFGAS